MRKIGVLTTSRADYGILRPVLKLLDKDELVLFAGGAHLSPEFGSTEKQIEFPVAERVECLMSSDTPEGIAKSIGLTAYSFGQAFARTRPDVMLIQGDRYETAAVAMAAIPFEIPIAHLGGGDVTRGAFDESFRHAITKMSHFHLCYAREQFDRIVQMGENRERVYVTGNPAIDELNDYVGVPPADNAIVVIFHPVTLEYEHTDQYVNNLLEALRGWDKPIVFILPNADTYGRGIRKKMRQFPDAQAHSNLVPGIFHNLLKHAACMVGNSSSALMEAPSFALPAVNIGTRQQGRMHARNVINTGYSVEEIRIGMTRALSPEFKATLQGMTNPYGDGHAAPRIVRALREMPLDVEKRFYER